AKVSLIEGDFYALLADKSARKRFEVEVPGVEARVDSGNFWVRHDSSGAKFTNSDDDPVRVAAHGETVVLGRNEGTLVGSGEAPMRKLDVLPAPVPRAPQEDRPAIAGQVELRWSPVAEATSYWLEIGYDPQFHRMASTRRGIPKGQFQPEALAPGVYHWRVSALDKFGLPGARSEVQRLEVRADKAPPYLLIEQPERGRILRKAPVIVTGQSEPGAQLTIDGHAVEIDAEGRFEHALTPREGDQTVGLRATDRAGNETSKSHPITYMPDRPLRIQFAREMPRVAPDHFLANGRALPLAGRTIARAHLAVEAEDRSRLARAYADDTGEFRVNVPLTGERQKLTLRVTAPSGSVTTSRVTVTIDRLAPEIVLDKPLPRLTTHAVLPIAGVLSETAMLAVNGRQIAIEAGRFAQRIELAEGDNPVEIVATDAAGNVGMKRWSVRLDRTPPEPVTHRIVATTKGGATMLRVTAVARDASGLARIARCIVGTDGWSSASFLRYDRATKQYAGVVWTGETDAADARLKQIELTDSAGNTRIFPLEMDKES
ncbi:MAG: Ig-like domain repeat protein, partial [Vicinamibacteraceae bacterium]